MENANSMHPAAKIPRIDFFIGVCFKFINKLAIAWLLISKTIYINIVSVSIPVAGYLRPETFYGSFIPVVTGS